MVDNSDLYNFRVGDESKKKEFQRRTRKLKKDRNITQKEIYEAGLKVFEKGDSEAQILHRRNKIISERDFYLSSLIEHNLLITAYNRKLRNKNKRYANYTDEKDVIKIFNENGDEIKEVPHKDPNIKYKKLDFF